MASPVLRQYFVPGYGISRQVIQSDIRYHCGPGAIVRPYVYQGRDGFLVTTQGSPLTEAQIEDLKESSRRFEFQQAERASQGSENRFINRPVEVRLSRGPTN